jgi:hypothetical protein
MARTSVDISSGVTVKRGSPMISPLRDSENTMLISVPARASSLAGRFPARKKRIVHVPDPYSIRASAACRGRDRP